MTAELRTLFLRQLREMVDYAQGNNDDADLEKSSIQKGEKDEQTIVKTITYQLD